MNIEEKALQYHSKGFNCAQCVLASCNEYTGLEEKTALAVAGALGGGVRCGEICGAVTGAALALGMCFPYNDADDNEAKANIAVKIKALTNKFKDEFGCIRCVDLKSNGHPCNELIKYCAKSAEEIIASSK